MTIESMDAHMSLSEFFVVAEDNPLEERVLGIKTTSEPFSADHLKNCPLCRMPIRDINRYGRIVRRAWIDEATKKFIVWANNEFVPLTTEMKSIETRLHEVKAETELDFGAAGVERASGPNSLAMQPIRLNDSREMQFVTVKKLIGKHQRYKPILQLHGKIADFVCKVDEAEQPFSKIYDLVRHARLHRGVDAKLEYSPNILQTRNRLLASILLLRCEYAILVEFLNLYKDKPGSFGLWMYRKLAIDLGPSRRDCEKLIQECSERHQPANEVEGLLFWARFAALERGMIEASEQTVTLLENARERLKTAKEICTIYPGSTAGMLTEVEDVETMLRDSTFYAAVTTEEKAAVYAAMAREFSGTGHWYYCANGHLFTVGECGMPMQTSRCPQCGSPVGGQYRQSVEGVD